MVLGSGGNREVTIANGGLRKDGSYTRTTPGVYYDEITGNKFTVTQDTISGEVGSTGIAVFYKDDNGHGGGSETSETRDIYLDVTNCSWFGSDSAVAAIKTDKDTTFSKMTTTVTTDANKTVYTAKVPKDATSATIVRMLPSGKYYNEKTITLNQSYNRYTSDGNWFSLTTDLYNTQEAAERHRQASTYILPIIIIGVMCMHIPGEETESRCSGRVKNDLCGAE